MLNGFLRTTKPLPALAISVAIAWIWHYFGMRGLPTAGSGLASAVSAISVLAQVASTMLGFMMAVLAILASITNTRLVRNMQRTGHFHQMLISIFMDSIAFACLTATTLLIAFRPDLFRALAPIVVGCTVFAAMLFIGALIMLWQTLAHLKPSAPSIE